MTDDGAPRYRNLIHHVEVLEAERDALAERADALTATLQLIVDLAGREWQEPNGSRRAAKDNFGERLWFISDAVMQEARKALAAPSAPKEGG